MVQIFDSEKPKNRLSEMLGLELGKGLSQGVNSYYANKAIDQVLNDKSNAQQDISAKMGKLQSALAPYGELGQKLFQQRMQIEEQGYNEQQSKIKNLQALEAEKRLFEQQEKIANIKANAQKKTQASQPIDPEQLEMIQKVRNLPEYREASPAKKYTILTDNGVSKENAVAEADIYAKEQDLNQKSFESSYKAQEDFIDETTKSYRGFETEMKPRLMQMQHIPEKDLIGPTASVFLDQLGIPLGALEDPSSELYNKLSQDLLKGLPETYGSRILKVEVDNFLKTIPTLLNSPNGRRMIASNMLKLGEMKEVFYNEMRKEQREHLDKNKPLPRDFQQNVFDQVKPQIDRINNDFVKMSEVKSIPEGTIPFFSPSGDIEFVPKEHAQWASENGGRRLW